MAAHSASMQGSIPSWCELAGLAVNAHATSTGLQKELQLSERATEAVRA